MLTLDLAESFWNNKQLIRRVKKSISAVFPVVEWAWSSTPTYPSGSIGYFIVTKDSKRNVKVPVRTLTWDEEKKMFKYYNKDIHTASFVVPTKARKEIWEDPDRPADDEQPIPEEEEEDEGD